MRIDSYLDIAEVVLRAARRPLSPRAIMEAAHRSGIVPPDLYGKSQHKTLQARLSEDILRRHLESKFYRTNPGRFFLAEFRSDPGVPDKYKDPFHARRRTRELKKDFALALDKKYVFNLIKNCQTEECNLLQRAIEDRALKHVDSRIDDKDSILVWAFPIVRRRDELLSYRVGRYRDNRETFANKRSIGFPEMVGFDDASLFDNDMGIVECGLRALFCDLDLSYSTFPEEVTRPSLSFAVVAGDRFSEPVALFVMEWACPDWFEPTARRLSLNEVRWIGASQKPNDLDAFEPWSAIAIGALTDKIQQRRSNGKKDRIAASCILKI